MAEGPCGNLRGDERVTCQIFRQFQHNGAEARPEQEIWYGSGGKGFGSGTVHHAAGTLRMPYRPSRTSPLSPHSVVEAANPVRTLAALALRLSQHLA